MSDYKNLQQATRDALKPRLLHTSPKGSAPLNLRIRKFKRSNSWEHEYIRAYKKNAWDNVRKANNESA